MNFADTGGNGNGGNGGQNKPMIWQFVPSGQLTGVTSSDGVTTLTNAADGTTVTTVDLTAVTESALGGQEGQHHILLTGEDGQSKFKANDSRLKESVGFFNKLLQDCGIIWPFLFV